jgi:hypothetical protein
MYLGKNMNIMHTNFKVLWSSVLEAKGWQCGGEIT